MASDLSSGCMEAIDILDDEKEEGELSLEDVSSSEEGGIGHLTCNYVINRPRACPDCKSWGDCTSWCTLMYHSRNRRDPVKGKENRHHVREAGCATTKHTASTLQEKNDDLVPISSDSDMEIVGLTDTSNRSKSKVKKKKRKKKEYDIITIDDLISPTSLDLPITEFGTLEKTHVIEKHYREVSPVRRRSGRSRVISRSPIRRHRSPVKIRSPIRPRSPLNRARSPILRSPRKLRSPKRMSPHRSLVRTTRRSSRLDSASSTRSSYVDRHDDVTKLLKKVKHLDSMGVLASESSVDRTKEHQSSLKEKLSNMLKRKPDSNGNATRLKKKMIAESDIVNDADDEEDLALLRQKALETKQKKSNKSSDHGSMDVEPEKKSSMKNDDQDEEALQLRMIALRSAVMKKHQNRVRRGIRANKKPCRSESPFSQSFLDDIPIPSEELLKFASPPCTPSYDSNHIEDMELDTDIEGEKEQDLPYSPTDKITTHVPIDTSLLGIELSDVSFINVNQANNKSSIFNDVKRVAGVPLLTTNVTSCYDNAYEAPQYYAYSPTQQCTELFLGSDLNEPGELPDYLKDTHCSSDNVVCDLIDGICCQVESPTSVALTQLPGARPIPVLTSLLPIPSTSPKTQQQVTEQSPGGILFTNVDSTFRDDKCTYEARKVSECPPKTDSLTMTAEPVSPNEINVLPETEKNLLASSEIDDRNHLPSTDHIPKEVAPCQAIEREIVLQEPLYMQGVPDITKDANKIPTLINKTLVPAPILRSNKQLQQPLPVTKKCETHVSEPSFKSAEMQPVIVTANAQNKKSGSKFKPIKMRVARKSAPILTTSGAFDNLTNENSENDVSEAQEGPSKDSQVVEHSAVTAPTNNDVALTRKKRKRVKKDRCKSLDSMHLLAEKRNNSDDCIHKDVNIIFSSAVEKQIKSAPSESNNDNKAQEDLMENGESELQNAVGAQESVTFNNITSKSKNVKKNELACTLSASVERPQERNIESRLSTNSDNLDSDTSNKTCKDIGDRRQSVDEDENELRAILLASLKRTKTLIDINSNSSAISITNCTVTNTQTQKTLTDTASVAASNATVNSNVLSSTKLSSSKAEEKKINHASGLLLVNGTKKRINSMDTVKGPQKKVMKKSVIPASTKVVNNAKKYQNMIVQRRSNLRKLDNNATKPNENVWSNGNSSKTLLHDTQRFVISLGSDTDSESDGEKRRDSDLHRDTVAAIDKHQTQDIGADFEQNLHKFLRDMRKEQEQSAGTKPGTARDAPLVTKGPSNMHTPLAVKHLPAPQQEEYRRLKQQILEREKLKLQRKVADNSNNNNKLLNSNVPASSSAKSVSSEKKSVQINQNPDKPTESEKNAQQSSGENKKRSVNVAKNLLISNVFPASANKNLEVNVTNHTSPVSSVKGAKKTILNNLSIRITNEIAPNHTVVESRTVESSCEKQPASDKQQNNRPALRALTKDEINRKYVQVLLKSDVSGRIVTINDNKSALQHDTPNANQSEKPVENDISIEILEEKHKDNEDSNNTTTFSNASTIKLSDLTAVNSSMNKEQEDITMETTMPLAQFEAERQESNRNSLTSSESNNNSNNNDLHKTDSVNLDNKNNTDDIWDALKKDVKEELGSLTNLPTTEQERYLRDTEHKLVARRYTVLDHLAEMSGNLRQWDMEKELQSSLASEVRKLKEQLKVAEERLQLQRNRVNSMGPKVSTARQKINSGRRECFKLSKICSTLGNRLVGKSYKLPEAGDQLLSDKLKEVANHTRQLTKKKRTQLNDGFENSSLSEQTSESSTNTRVEEDLLQEQPVNDAVDGAGSKNDACCLNECNDGENLSPAESSSTLNLSQTLPNQLTPAKRKEPSASELHNDEQVTPLNQDASEPKLYQSTPIEQNNKQRSCNTTLEVESSVTDSFSCQDSEQNNKKTSPLPSLSVPTTNTTIATITTATTTTVKTTTIAPYESILSHLKIPRNTNPHGVLCPYEMMGICRDEDCQYVHQSRNQT